jgi:hypothetical protein
MEELETELAKKQSGVTCLDRKALMVTEDKQQSSGSGCGCPTHESGTGVRLTPRHSYPAKLR